MIRAVSLLFSYFATVRNITGQNVPCCGSHFELAALSESWNREKFKERERERELLKQQVVSISDVQVLFAEEPTNNATCKFLEF